MYQPDFPPVPFRLGLYPVVDSVQWIERLLDAGVRTLQLRIKDRRDEEVEADVVAAIALGRRYNARLFINDYWRLAIKHQAYGVHLGQEDLQATDLSAIRAAGLRLGVSTHDDMEIDVALAARPSYIALGHVFPTQTKQMPSAPQGLEQLARHVERLADYPTVAIGGISLPRAPAVMATGVGSIAVVSAITQAADWRLATAQLLEIAGVAMNDRDFMRYSRQILLDDIALDGQQKLLDSQVLIIGLGGLGTPAALYLAGAGVGTLVLADDDDVHLSNLQRQILFTTEDIDRPKSQVSHQRLTQLNPDIQLTALQQRLTGEALKDAVAQADVVLDCTDNMATRQEINAACVALNTPLITASAVGFGGQLMVLTPPWEQGCYRCLWPDNQEPERNCRTAGVVGPVVGVMGTLQALEAIKLLSGIETPAGELRLFDGKSSQWRSLALRRASGCPVCGGSNADPV
ncbi:thiamine phosphate synthase [Escherichia coli]|nr:thiamine phosphate synthase [Escherichia coli]EHB6925136.1 thiamine phosphate synthase [Escherichia coli]MDN0742912.1 thiamine phosphate synthase [Escherichia coli]NPN93324.1 thiamine phosphate synthase [Escherichia coli]NPQ67774.1 thiamine phosphate synthase [Escherichia coli]